MNSGKIERFNRSADAFLSENKLERPETLVELNRRFWIWLDEFYHHKPHSSLKDNMSPAMAFNMDKEPLRFVDAEERKADKSGCVSFNGKKYEIENGLLLIGGKVTVIYEHSDAEHLWIEYDNFPRTTAKPLEIGEHAGQRPPLPPMLEKGNVTKSRLLDAAEKKKQKMSSHFVALVVVQISREIPAGELYLSNMLLETVSRLEYAASNQLFAVLTGDCGTGKTTAVRRLKNSPDESKFTLLYLTDSQLTPPDTSTTAFFHNSVRNHHLIR